MPLTTGQTLNDRYRIVSLLGQGGFGAVYRAWDLNLNRAVAVKENLEASETAARQFTREASILANLHHPNLPRVTDYFFIPDQGQYLVMDFVEGKDLQTLLEEKGVPLSEGDALAWVSQICDALTHLHAHKPAIIHRDIKPANIKITPEGKAVLVDFGIAKVYDANAPTTLGARAITPGYSPQEQYGRGGKTDARSDVYALGATLYALLACREPVECVERSMGVPLPAPRSLNPAIAPRVEAAILRAMAMRPDDRFQSMAQFKAALHGLPSTPAVSPEGRASSAPVTGGRAEVRSLPGAPRRTVPWVWAGLAVTVLCIASAAVAGFSLLDFNPKPVTMTATPTQLTLTGGATAIPSPVPSVSPALSPTITVTSPPRAGDQRVNAISGSTLVYIPAGQFEMGVTAVQAQTLINLCPKCPINTFDHSQPAHPVSLSAYWIELTETTNAQYAGCVAAGVCLPPSSFGSDTRQSYYDDPVYANFPVIFVNWQSAVTYCQWAGGRLPTEAEWEYAARGGDGRLFPWGSQPPGPGLANSGQMVGDTTEAGAYPLGASPFGLLDMAGNVWEWVADWWESDYYVNSPAENPQGPPSSSDGRRVGRGGSYYWGDGFASAVYHDWYDPEKANAGVGFRCVVDAEP